MTRRTAPGRPEQRYGSDVRGSRARPLTSGDFRRRRLGAALAALVLVVGLGFTARVLLYDAGLFDVEDVKVSGAVTVAVPDVLAAAAVTLDGPLADADTAGIAARVAQLPGVALVQVGREWPHAVTVAVTERVPVASAVTPGGVSLVDGSGVVYAGPVLPALPRLTFTGAGPDDPTTRDALAALAALPDPLRAQVLTVDATVAEPGVPVQVVFGLSEDRRVRWGSQERASEKAAVLVALLTQPGRVYDVTSPDLPTIAP